MTQSQSRRATLALGGVVALALVVGLGVRMLTGGPGRIGGVERPDGGPTGGGVEKSGRPVAALREGRFDEAFPWYVGPGAGEPGAEDLSALGVSLVAKDRLVLGWAALEAARRIDRDHRAAGRALGELEAGLKAAAGPDRAALREAAGEVENLRALRGGPALGLLAMGLAAYSGPPGGDRALLDRLAIRDRAELRAVEGPAGAVKLVARLLMEVGRPAEAEVLLRPYADGRGPDREAAWLLSRAALQLGQGETADAMLERAGGFGRDGAWPEPAPYIGSRKCAECHRTAYRAAQRSSPHARTISFGAGLKDIPLPDRPVPDSMDPKIHHRFSREAADCIRLETRDAEGRVARAIVAYALGSGEHGITMVARDDPGGTPRQLRVSYYAKDRAWHGTKGVVAAPHGPDEFLGMALSEKALRQCLHCHTTWFRAALPNPSTPGGPESLDRGIGCERCHGPGLNHVKAVEAGYPELAIAVTKDTPPKRLMKSCEECHGSNGLVEPSDPEFTRFQGTTLKFSRCFTGSAGAIHCATCHDPHRGLDTTASHYEPKCLSCHAASGSGTRGGSGGAACPVNPTSGCIECHMPKVPDPSFQIRFTNHNIRVHRETDRDGTGSAGGNGAR